MLLSGIWATAAVGIGAIACVAVAVMVGLGSVRILEDVTLALALAAVVIAGGVAAVGLPGCGEGSVCVGGGTLIVDGPPTGPEQILPLSQHPMLPLLARSQ